MDPSPDHRHQSSLEFINFASSTPLDASLRAQARRRFVGIVSHFEAAIANDSTGDNYNRARLVRLTYEYVRSEESRDIFLRAFFDAVALPIEGDDVDLDDDGLEEALGSALTRFADYLMDNFFLPLRASSNQTPQPSPAFHSAVQRAQGGGVQNSAGTPGRLSELRCDCLARDRHRCVITRQFDHVAAEERTRKHGEGATDDDGNGLRGTQFDRLEVAHILPHALTKVEPGQTELRAPPARGQRDRPARNALTLAARFHDYLGLFQVFFQPVPHAAEPHTYRIDTFLHPVLVQDELPVTRTLFQTEDHTVDPPSPRLLALHCAIAHILHLSGAAQYIDKVLGDADKVVQPDGSTELGRLVALGLGGWLGSVSA